MKRALLLIAAACTHRTPPPAHPTPAPPAAKPPIEGSPWAKVPVRVMTWTASGVEEIGRLPTAPPRALPEHWFVEPLVPLDQATFATLIGLVRSEHVPGLSLRARRIAGWLGMIAQLPELHALVLDDTDVDGAALRTLGVTLDRLYLARTAVDDAAITLVAAARHPLEVLDLEDTAVTDAALPAITQLATLHALDLAGTRISDDGGAQLAALHALHILDLGRTRVAAKTVAALHDLPLTELFLDATHVKGEIASLANLAPGLVRFDVSNTAHHPTDAEIAWLANAPRLLELGLSGAKVHDGVAAQLAKLPALRDVRLAGTPITATTIKVLAARTDLEEIDLGETPVDDASAAALIAQPHLRMLRLDRTPISDAALAATPSPQLRELYVSHTRVGDAGLAILDALPHLTALGIGDTAAGEPTLDRVIKLAELETLVLSKLRIAPELLPRLGALHALVRLYLDATHADDATIAALAPAATTLRVLHLAGTEVSEAGLPALRALAELDELTVGDSRMHAGIADLSAWPRLRTVSLVGLDLGDRDLTWIAHATSLVDLDLSATDVRDPTALAALPHLRTLGLAQTHLSPAGVAAVKALAARGVEVVR